MKTISFIRVLMVCPVLPFSAAQIADPEFAPTEDSPLLDFLKSFTADEPKDLNSTRITLPTSIVIAPVSAEDTAGMTLEIPQVPKELASVEALNAKIAADSAKAAASMARKVATNSMHITEDVQAVLTEVQKVLHDARTSATNLSKNQSQALAKAEEKLEGATTAFDYGQFDVANDHLMVPHKIDSSMSRQALASNSAHGKESKHICKELQQLREELAKLREKHAKSDGMQVVLNDLEDTMKGLETKEENMCKTNISHNGLKAREEMGRKQIEEEEAFREEQRAELARAEEYLKRKAAELEAQRKDLEWSWNFITLQRELKVGLAAAQGGAKTATGGHRDRHQFALRQPANLRP